MDFDNHIISAPRDLLIIKIKCKSIEKRRSINAIHEGDKHT